MRRILKKLAFCLSLFVLTYDCAPPVQTVQAGTAHVHDANCYAGTIHAAHTSDCYEDVTVQKYCNGTYIYDGTVTDDIKVKTVLFGCSNRNCSGYHNNWSYIHGSYTYLVGRLGTWYPSEYPKRAVCPDCGRYCTQTTESRWFAYYFCTNRNCGYYYNGDPYNCIDYVLFYKPYEAVPSERVICPGCGRTCGKTSREETWAENVDRYKCSACGDVRYNAPQAYSHFSPQLSGQIHGAYSVTQKQLTCNKVVGKYYDENGNECPCLCGKMVKNITAVMPEQIVKLGDPINAKAYLELYNGQRVSGYECTVSGYDPNDLTGTWQEVTLTVKSSDYPYIYNSTTGKRESGTASTKIRVKVKNPVHRLELWWNEGGEIICLSGNATEESRSRTAAVYAAEEGESITIGIRPKEGHRFVLENFGHNVTFSSALYMYECKIDIANDDVLVKAEFVPQSIGVTFVPNGGNWGGMTGNFRKTATYGMTYAAERAFPPDPMKSGHIFAGWYDENGRKVELTDNCRETRDLTLFADWVRVPDGTVGVNFEDELPYPLPLNISGFDFDPNSFWHREEKLGNGYGEALLKGSVLRGLKSLELFGKWNAELYTVFLDPDGGRTEDGTECIKVRYHESIGRLPAAIKDNAVFMGWFLDSMGEELTERIYDGSILTVPADMRLKAQWEENGGNIDRMSAEPIEVNNGPVTERHADKSPVIRAGNRLGIEAEFMLSESLKPPFRTELIPHYGLYDPDTGLCEAVHVFSSGRLGDRIVTFYERGKDAGDGITANFTERKSKMMLYWTLPHLSCAVKDENYEELMRYSAVNTLSGNEDFFERGCILKTSFDLRVTDAKGERFEVPNATAVYVIME